MDVIKVIVDILPANCKECRFSDVGYCVVTNKLIPKQIYSDGRMKSCKLEKAQI